MSSRQQLFALASIALSTFAACQPASPISPGGDGGNPTDSGNSDGGSAGGTVEKSSKPRAAASTIAPADVQTQSKDDTAFAFDLYGQLKGQSGNLFFSPYSISSALAMAYAGAVGDTATAIATTLRFSQPAAQVYGAFNALDAAFASRAQAGGSGANGGPFQLNVVNALWAQTGLALEAPFLDTLAINYGAGVRLEDFATSPDPSRADINAWVSDNTAGKIPDLLGPGSITQDTRVVLTNAIYFNAAWATAFNPMATQPAPFHALDGSTPSVPLMHEGLETRYGQGAGYEVVELPYENPALSLTVIVPAAGSFDTVEGQLSASFLDDALALEAEAEVTLSLPKFGATTKASLRAPLTALGMGAAFGDGADFSGIDGTRDLSISDVVHQATVTVDEAGTEAAAATAVIIGATSVLQRTATLTIDRPFFIVLRDQPTNAVLFIGRIVQP